MGKSGKLQRLLQILVPANSSQTTAPMQLIQFEHNVQPVSFFIIIFGWE